MAALSALAASSVVAAPAVAATPTPVPPIDFGSLAGPNSPGTDKGRIGSPNGVSSIVVTVTDYNGRKLGPNLYNTSFSPRVQWSARDRSNAQVKGENCQIEVAFPDTSRATYKSAACKDAVPFRVSYGKPGVYSIIVTDRVSGARATQTFAIE